MFASPGEIAFAFGPIQIRWYGILIALGIVAAYTYAASLLKRIGRNPEILDKLFLWVVGGGVLGARLYYVLFNVREYAKDPLEIFQVWHGGLAIHGALFGGALGLFFAIKKYTLDFLSLTDLLLPGVLLAQGIGRWGNFFNSEAFGRPTDLPWKLFIPLEKRPLEFQDFEFFHPTFLYESLWNLLGFAILALLARKVHKRGVVTAGYFMWYSLGRFFFESLRTDSLMIGNFRAAQAVSVLLFLGGMMLLLRISAWGKMKHQ